MERPPLSEAGIAAMEVYFPRQCVEQGELERFDGASAGKYTVGLGQQQMAYVGDREDVVSMCLTVTQRLLERHHVSPRSIGRLEVGTETIIDKSKAVKTALMALFADSGNHEVEGVDNTNACYGGTAAMFNSLAWMESPWWDGRDALVVCGDVAVYAPGGARATGGAGAVAMLLRRGAQAPLRFEVGLRATHMEDTHDFYKPELGSEYPTVNGAATMSCYLRALDRCYSLLRARAVARPSAAANGCVDSEHAGPPSSAWPPVDALCDHAVFHAPFNKMVRKSFARLRYNDMLASGANDADEDHFAPLRHFAHVPAEKTYADKDLERAFMKESSALYERMVEPGEWLARRLGNTYTASVWSSLAALIEAQGDRLVGRRILLFSYGSGLASSMFTLSVVSSVEPMRSKLDLAPRLERRRVRSPEEYSHTLAMKEEKYGRPNVVPKQGVDELWEGTYYLAAIDAMGRRSYQRRPTAAENGRDVHDNDGDAEID